MFKGITDSNIKIVTNGLLEHYDAAQLRSYSGSGTTWYDLSGRGKNATLTNGPTFSSAYGGGIVYDLVDDYVTLGVSGADGNMYSSSGITLAIWFKKSYFLGNRILMYNGRVDPDGVDGWDLLIGSGGGTNNLFGYITGADNISYYIASNNGVYSWDTNAYAVFTYDRANMRLYMNGVACATPVALTQYIRVQGLANSVIHIGRGGLSNTNPFDGTIYSASIYNRALTATEVLQNYNATKRRFGL